MALGLSWKQGNGSNNVGTAEEVSRDGGFGFGEYWDAGSKICRIWVRGCRMWCTLTQGRLRWENSGNVLHEPKTKGREATKSVRFDMAAKEKKVK